MSMKIKETAIILLIITLLLAFANLNIGTFYSHYPKWIFSKVT